jgi:hypothetical protein
VERYRQRGGWMVNQVERADAVCDSERGRVLRSPSTLLGVQQTTDEIPNEGGQITWLR